MLFITVIVIGGCFWQATSPELHNDPWKSNESVVVCTGIIAISVSLRDN